MNLFTYFSPGYWTSRYRSISYPLKISGFILGIAGLLTGCSTTLDPVQLRSAIRHDLAVPDSEIIYTSPASYGFAMGNSRSTAFQEGIYVQTTKAIALYQPKSKESVMRDVLLPVDRIKRAGLSNGGAFNQDQQIQLTTDLGILAIFIKAHNNARSSSISESETAFSHLRNIDNLPILLDASAFIYPIRPYNHWDYPEPPYFGRGSGIFFHFPH